MSERAKRAAERIIDPDLDGYNCIPSALRETIAEAVAAEKERCADWALSYAKDCGCGHKIAAAIREEPE